MPSDILVKAAKAVVSVKFPHREPFLIRDANDLYNFISSLQMALIVAFDKPPQPYN